MKQKQLHFTNYDVAIVRVCDICERDEVYSKTVGWRHATTYGKYVLAAELEGGHYIPYVMIYGISRGELMELADKTKHTALFIKEVMASRIHAVPTGEEIAKLDKSNDLSPEEAKKLFGLPDKKLIALCELEGPRPSYFSSMIRVRNTYYQNSDK